MGETVLPLGTTFKKIGWPFSSDGNRGSGLEVTPTRESREMRFLHVFHVGENTEHGGSPRLNVATNNKATELTVADSNKIFRLTLPTELLVAGRIAEVAANDGNVLVRRRVLPSGVMPHGPKGAELMERRDAPYRGEQMPGWDVGRPSSHLVEAVEKKPSIRVGQLSCSVAARAPTPSIWQAEGLRSPVSMSHPRH